MDLEAPREAPDTPNGPEGITLRNAVCSPRVRTFWSEDTAN